MRYMVTFTLAVEHQIEIAALMPDEQAHSQALQERGIIEAVYLSSAMIQNEHGGHGWLVMKGESQTAVENELAGFPLHSYTTLEEIAALI